MIIKRKIIKYDNGFKREVTLEKYKKAYWVFEYSGHGTLTRVETISKTPYKEEGFILFMGRVRAMNPEKVKK